MPQQPSWQVQAGLVKEAGAWGTGGVPAIFFPCRSAKLDSRFNNLLEEGYTGIAAKDKVYLQGTGWTDVDWPDLWFYPDTGPHFFMAMLGVDTVTGTARTGTLNGAVVAGATSLSYNAGTGGAPLVGDIFGIDTGLATAEQFTLTAVSGAGPYSLTIAAPGTRFAHANAAAMATLFKHSITLNNAANSPSYAASKFENLVATARQSNGVYFEQLSLKFANPGKLMMQAKGRGKIATNVAKPAAVYSSFKPYIPWQWALTLAGVANARLVDFQIDVKRPLDPDWGMASSQDMQANVVTDMEVNAGLTFKPQDYTEFNYYLQNTQPVFSFVGLSDVNSLTIQMSQLALEDPSQLDHGQPTTRFISKGRAIANATDGGTGNSPLKVIAVNSQSAGY